MSLLARIFGGRFSGGGEPRPHPDSGKIRLDRSWAFFGVYLFWASGFSSEFSSRGIFGSIVLGVATVALGFMAALFHEFGHRIAARMMHLPYDGSQLSFWGGFPRDRVDFGPPGVPGIVVRLAGPAMNLLLFEVSKGLLTVAGGSWTAFFPELAYLLQVFSGINALIALLNLIPGLPFDMGVVITLIFCRASGREAPEEGSLAEKIGWGVGLLMSLVGLFLLTRGMVITGFGSMLMGYLVLVVLIGYRERNRIAHILDREGVEPFLEPVKALVRDDMWVQEAIMGPFFEGQGRSLPVVSGKTGLYRGDLSWEEIRLRSFSRWDGVRVSDLSRLSAGGAITDGVSPSQILEILGQRQEGAPVVRNGRIIGWLRLDRLAMSGLIEAYIDNSSMAMSDRGGRPATPPECSSPSDSVPAPEKDARELPGSLAP